MGICAALCAMAEAGMAAVERAREGHSAPDRQMILLGASYFIVLCAAAWLIFGLAALALGYDA